ncbi:hypothetical protein [Acidithiobacillus ferrivorans]|uniref:hypothetical protein n=1 Tax=Acidithiobacillus ferrivorans TaxID=160808 RepID=UPI001C070936|nr:hypothetical protein [Acidithiobacillus ferrivorans]MBU2849711.1 hypothetical protein [Acidithiobacillus ferrivorans]
MADDNDIRLVEYQVICTAQRHEDTTKWSVVGLTYTGAAAAIVWSLTSQPWVIGVVLLLAAVLVWVGSSIYAQFQSATKVRLTRAYEIETMLGMKNHRRIRDRDMSRGYTGPEPYLGGLAQKLVCFSKVLAAVLAVLGVLCIAVALMLAILIPFLAVSTICA